MKKALAAVGATLLGVTGAAVGTATAAQAAPVGTTLPDCTTSNQLTFDHDDTANNFYGTCTPQYGVGKAEFTVTDTAGFPDGFVPLDDPSVTTTTSTDTAAVDAYFDSSTNGFTNLRETSATETVRTYDGSLVYKLAGVTQVPTSAIPANCLADGDTYTNAFRVSYAPTTVTFTQTVAGKPVAVTVTSAPAPVTLAYTNRTVDPQEGGQVCASNGTDALLSTRSQDDYFGLFAGFLQGGNTNSTLTPFTTVSTGFIKGDLGNFFPHPDAPALSAPTSGDTTATVTVTPAASTGATITGYEYSIDGGATWKPLTTSGPAADGVVTGTITGLTDGTTYQVLVRTTSDSGTSPASNAVGVSPRAVAPTVTTISTGNGTAAGGTTVTVTGSGFVAGATSVTIGGTTVPATVISSTQLTFVTPAHAAGSVAFSVTTPAGTVAGPAFTYDAVVAAAPAATPIAPVAAAAAVRRTGALAYTGSDPAPVLTGAALAVLAGLGLVVGSRRRARRTRG